MDNGVKRVNKKCTNYPCHRGLEDCTFCFCPLYPCLDRCRGGYVFSKRQNQKVWSCRECSWIHRKEVVDSIFQSIRNHDVRLSDKQRLKNRENAGVIILAHGSKLDNTKETARRISESLKKDLRLECIMPAYLQFCFPPLSKAVESLVGKGCRKIVVIPYFLFNGNHVTRDVPAAIQREKEKFPDIEFIYAKALGEDEQKIGEIVAQRIREAL